MSKPRSVWILVVLLVVGCGGSTTIEQSWRAPDVELQQLRNVVTVYVSPDGSIRRSLEDKMAAELSKRGIRARPMYSIVPEDADRDQTKSALLAAGFDGVVATRLVSKESFSTGSFDDYWGTAWYDPNYAITEMIVRVETSVYSLATGRLLWSALSRTIDPYSTNTVIDEVTEVVSKELKTDGVLISTRP